MLKGLKVLEMAGLGSSTMCGLFLQDYGASVTRVTNPNAPFMDHILSPGRSDLALDLKNSSDKRALLDMCKDADILIDPYRPRCFDRLGFPPDLLHNINKRLILTRISGYGHPEDNENYDYYLRPGLDINYLAESGILWLFTGEDGGQPIPPANLIADIAGGAFPAMIGILMALFDREKSGVGKIVDVGITDGISYMSTQLFASRQFSYQKAFNPIFSVHWPNISRQCANLLDGGAPFYRTYATKDNKYVAVGAIESHYYANLLNTLGVAEKSSSQLARDAWPRIAAILSAIFASETRDHWCEKTDLMRSACLSPVYSPEEAVAKRPQQFYRSMNFSLSPLIGATRDEGAFSIRIPRVCPIISDFPAD